MTSFLPVLTAAVAGAVLRLGFSAWQLASHRWDSWFPLFRRLARAALSLTIAGSALVSLIVIVQSLDTPTWAVVFIAWGCGLALPSLARSYKQAKPQDRTERGAYIADTAELKKLVRKNTDSKCITLGGIRIPRKAEPYHLLIDGSTGSGKSVAIKSLITTLRARGDTVILVDSGGEFCSLFYDPQKDVVFNPFDARCAPWSPMAEVDGPWDAEALARSIVPDGVGDNKEWNSYAQTFISSSILALQKVGRNSLKDLLWVTQSASSKDLANLLHGTPAHAQVSAEKTLASIRTIVGNYLSAYNHLETTEEAPFSVRQFVEKARGSFLFLTYRDDQLDTLRHMLGCILDVASRAVLSLPADENRRIWLIIDEFASIGKVQSVEAFATKARKAGGCLVVGLQSISQLKDRYGEYQAYSILSCLSNSLTLRCADADTAELMSRHLGEAEVVRASGGVSTSSATGLETASWNEQNSVRRIVMASELQALPNLEGYLKLAGSYPVSRIKLQLPASAARVAEPFVARARKPALAPQAMQPAPAPVAAAAPVPPASPAWSPAAGAGLQRNLPPAEEQPPARSTPPQTADQTQQSQQSQQTPARAAQARQEAPSAAAPASREDAMRVAVVRLIAARQEASSRTVSPQRQEAVRAQPTPVPEQPSVPRQDAPRSAASNAPQAAAARPAQERQNKPWAAAVTAAEPPPSKPSAQPKERVAPAGSGRRGRPGRSR